MKIAYEDREILDSQNTETLAGWWSELNRFKWPEKLPNPEPKEYIQNGRRSLIMAFIIEKIGMKECLRDWNKKSMPGLEFDLWHDSGMRPITNDS